MEARGASAQVVVVWNAMCAAASFENQDVLKALEPYGANVAYDFHGYETFLRYAARHAPCAMQRGRAGAVQHSVPPLAEGRCAACCSTHSHARKPSSPLGSGSTVHGSGCNQRGQQGLLTRHYHGWVLWSR